MARNRTPRLACLTLFLGLLAASCGSEGPEAPGASGAERVTVDGASSLVFEPAELRLPRALPGGFSSGLAQVRNVSSAPVEILSFSAPCECTSAAPELPRTLSPGESFSFPVRLDLSRLLRGGLSEELGEQTQTVRRSISLWTASGRSADLRILVDVSEELEAEPVVTQLRQVVRGSTERRTVLLRSGRKRPDEDVLVLGIEVVPGPLPLRVEERRVDRDVELELILGPLDEAGEFEAEIKVLTDREPEPVRLLLRAEVLEPLRVTPDSIEAPAADPTRPIAVDVHVQRRDGGALSLLEARSTNGRIKLRPLGLSPNGAQVVNLLIAVPPWPEEVRGEVQLDTDFPGEAGRLTVPVFVKARPPR